MNPFAAYEITNAPSNYHVAVISKDFFKTDDVKS